MVKPLTADERRRRIAQYLESCSDIALDAYLLGAVTRAAEFRKALREMIDAWVEAEAEHRFTAWIRAERKRKNSLLEVSDDLDNFAA